MPHITTLRRDANRVPLQTDFLLEICRGSIPTYEGVRVFGHNPDVDPVDLPEDMWEVGGLIVPPTTARTHDIVSGDANDAAAGTGARTVYICGLDSDWKEQNETVTMNGTTNVATTKQYVRINEMYVATAGSSHYNEGAITATAQTDSTVTLSITAEESYSHSSMYSVPAGKTAYITDGYLSIRRRGTTSDSMLNVDFIGRINADTATSVEQAIHHLSTAARGSSNYYHPFPLPLPVGEKTDLFIRVTYVTDTNMSVSGGYDLILIDN